MKPRPNQIECMRDALRAGAGRELDELERCAWLAMLDLALEHGWRVEPEYVGKETFRSAARIAVRRVLGLAGPLRIPHVDRSEFTRVWIPRIAMMEDVLHEWKCQALGWVVTKPEETITCG